jgi:signal peptidase I
MPDETTPSGRTPAEAVPLDGADGIHEDGRADAVDRFGPSTDGATTTTTDEPPSTGGPGGSGHGAGAGGRGRSPSDGPSSGGVARRTGSFVKELAIIVVIALVASALLRAFVVQAFYVPSGSMLPTIQLQDRILVSRIGDVHRGEVVVFEDPGGWIPPSEQAPPPGKVHKAFEFVGVLPASGHEHLVKRVIGLPGDHVVCCNGGGRLTINGKAVDESGFIAQGNAQADNVPFDVVVPKDHIFVLGDNRYVSGDSSRHLSGQEAFIPMDLVTGRAFAVIWPFDHRQILHIPDAYDGVPDGQTPPEKGLVSPVGPAEGR